MWTTQSGAKLRDECLHRTRVAHVQHDRPGRAVRRADRVPAGVPRPPDDLAAQIARAAGDEQPQTLTYAGRAGARA